MSAERRILVLGSNSFSGSDLVDLLLDSPANVVLGISRSPEKSDLFLPYLLREHEAFRFVQADLNRDLGRLIDVIDDFKPSYVVNFAAQSEVAPSWVNPDQWYETNIVSLARLTEALRKRSYLEQYLHISSPEAYGSCAHDVTEDEPLHPSTPYAVSKAAADLHLATLVAQYGFPCVTVRATNVYGAHQQLWKIIPRSIITIRKGNRVQLHGGGLAVKSYIHIRDVSLAEQLLIDHGQSGRIYNVSPGVGYPVRDVVSRIATMLGQEFADVVEIVGERPGQDAAYLVDSSRIRTEMGWHALVDLNIGLQYVVEWIDGEWDRIAVTEKEYVHVA